MSVVFVFVLLGGGNKGFRVQAILSGCQSGGSSRHGVESFGIVWGFSGLAAVRILLWGAGH